MKIPCPNYTQTPNDLFDHWLPFLREVELKVLLVIMRKTFGYHKSRDMISISQLERMTGSTQTNIVKATRDLTQKGLITKIVEGCKGQQLTYYELIVNADSNIYDPSQDRRGPLPRQEGTPPNSGDTKENIQKKTYKRNSSSPPLPLNQNQTSSKLPDIAAVSSVSKNFHENKKQCEIHPLLKEIDIPIADKKEISSKYSQAEIENAIKWAMHPETKITKSLAAAIKWACQEKPRPPENKQDRELENKYYAKRYDGAKSSTATVITSNSYVEILHGGVSEQFCLKYTEKGFIEQFQNALRKNGVDIMPL